MSCAGQGKILISFPWVPDYLKGGGIWEYYSEKENLVGRKFFESQYMHQKFINIFMVFNIFPKIKHM